MKVKTGTIVFLLIISLFIGITVIAIGLGAAIPSINRISKPIVCPNGDLIIKRELYKPYPGSNVLTVDWYCVDKQNQSKEKLNIFQMGLFSGIIYGLIIFVLLLILILIKTKKRKLQ